MQFNSSAFKGVSGIVFLEPLSLKKVNSYSFNQVVTLKYSDFYAWGWKTGSSVLSDCQMTNHRATVCYWSSLTLFSSQDFIFICFAKLQDEISMEDVWGWAQGVCWKSASRWSLFLLRTLAEKIYAVCFMPMHIQCSLKTCKLWRRDVKFGRRKLQMLFVNCALSEVRVKMNKNKPGSSGIQGRGS